MSYSNPRSSFKKKRQLARKQVKQACMNCKRAHTRCEEVRPCPRCEHAGIQCLDAPRKRKRKEIDDDDEDCDEKFERKKVRVQRRTQKKSITNNKKSKSTKSNKLIKQKEIKPKELVEKPKMVSSPPPRTRASTRMSKKQKVRSPIIEKIAYKQVPIEEEEEEDEEEEEEEERLSSSPCSSPSASPEPTSDEIETVDVYHVQTINGKISLNNNSDFLIADYAHFNQPFDNMNFDERFTYHVNDQLLRQLTEPLSTSMLSFPEPTLSGVDMLFKDATLSSLYYEESFSHPNYSEPYSLRKNDEELQRERENYLRGWMNTS